MALLLRGSHGSQALSFDGQRLGVSVSRAVPATARPGPTSSGSRLDAPEAHASLGRWPCLFVSEFAWRARSSTSRIKRDTQASHPWKCDDVPAQVWPENIMDLRCRTLRCLALVTATLVMLLPRQMFDIGHRLQGSSGTLRQAILGNVMMCLLRSGPRTSWICGAEHSDVWPWSLPHR